MRRTFRQLAAVKPGRYLEAGVPTGLTGLETHHAPRSTLMYLYASTLDKLQQFPEASLYRQSTEALTKHRLSIVSAVEPAGYKEWAERAKKIVAENPELFNNPKGGISLQHGRHGKVEYGGTTFVRTVVDKVLDEQTDEWDGEPDLGAVPEGPRTEEERKGQSSAISKPLPEEIDKDISWESEPSLTAEQIQEVENKIGSGLIEEVIQVAEGELKLTDVLLKAKVWEDLEEKPVEGQWTYFSRDTATPTTQAPPQK